MLTTGISKMWTRAGSFVLLFALGMFFASRSPSGACLPLAACIPTGNAASTRYWGVLGCALGVAFVAWLGSRHAARHSAETLWWKRLPRIALLEGNATRSLPVALAGLGGFILLPVIAALAMGAVLWTAAIVRRSTGTPLRGGPLEARVAALYDRCSFFDYCFQLGDTKGIEYKPILTDGALVVAVLLAAFCCARLARRLTRAPSLGPAPASAASTSVSGSRSGEVR
jgi:hypothetical protein